MRVGQRQRCDTRTGRPAGSGRRGVIVMLETVLVLPVMLLVLLVLGQFYLLVTAREEMLNASRTGARVAALRDGRDRAEAEQEAVQAVRRALGSGRLAGADVRVTWSQDVQPAPAAGEVPWVQVTCEVPTQRISPDFLGWGGRALGGSLVTATVMPQE